MSYQPQELKNKVERKINKVKAQFEFEEDFRDAAYLFITKHTFYRPNLKIEENITNMKLVEEEFEEFIYSNYFSAVVLYLLDEVK